jgi:hypothetical protein
MRHADRDALDLISDRERSSGQTHHPQRSRTRLLGPMINSYNEVPHSHHGLAASAGNFAPAVLKKSEQVADPR